MIMKLDGVVMEALEDRLDSFIDLPVGWDGYNAVPPNAATVQKAKEIIKALSDYDWQAVPLDASLQLEHHCFKWKIEIFIQNYELPE